MAKKKEQCCSFCGRPESEVGFLMSGLTGMICDDCARRANEILDEIERDSRPAQQQKMVEKLPRPDEIKANLDQYVIGQEEAKRYLSVAVYNHYKRLNQPHTDDEVEFEKSNIIMVGPTGTGKTLLAKTIARQLQVPFAIVDATVLTQAGYVGEDIESILTRLLQVANFDVKQAERGIVFVDELDKIARKGDNASITRDVSGEGVQQGLLKLLEGADVLVPPEGGRKHPEQKMISVNTSNILFICGGAFDGIERVIANRLNTRTVGYGAMLEKQKVDEKNLLTHVTAADLKAFGLIPELIGRLPILTHLDPLDRDALRRILVEPKNSLTKQYIKMFAIDGIELQFSDDCLDYIVEMAIQSKLGARGLRSIMETVMMEAMYLSPSGEFELLQETAGKTTLVVDKKYAEGRLKNATLQA